MSKLKNQLKFEGECLRENHVGTKKKFYKMAEKEVDEHCINLDGSPLTGEKRRNLVHDLAFDMNIGSEATKDMYIKIGAASGVAVTLAGCYIYNRIKKWRVNKWKEQNDGK